MLCQNIGNYGYEWTGFGGVFNLLFITELKKFTHHPREGGGLAHRRKAIFINAAYAACRIPAFAGMA